MPQPGPPKSQIIGTPTCKNTAKVSIQDKIRIRTKLFIQIFKAYLNKLQYLGKKKKAEKNIIIQTLLFFFLYNNFIMAVYLKRLFEINIKRARVKNG